MCERFSGQTSMLVMVLAIIVIMALGVFLITSSIKPQSDEYNNLYVHNLLLSVLRANTGYRQPCDTIASAISCASLTPDRSCEGMSCYQFSARNIPAVIREVIKPSFDYYMIVQPENWEIVGGERITYGNPDVAKKRSRWTANEKILQYESNLQIQLIIAYR
ncbi:MAG: hypothetical protein J7K72_02685 [Candidatus Aenigmarchaeota archaeon]|nr:hypothetical protein [Candidatus Aenigmarchaeota archaeon]